MALGRKLGKEKPPSLRGGFLGKPRERVVSSALNNVARHSRNSKVIIQLHSPLFVEIQLFFFSVDMDKT